jgi:hypothetical protein
MDLKTAVEQMSGSSGSDQESVTLSEVQALINSSATVGGGSASSSTDDAGSITTTPPMLTGLTAIGGYSFVILTWDTIPYGYHDHATIYRAAVDDRTQAEAIGTSRTLIYADYVPNSATYYYWIRPTSAADVEGPWNDTDGTPGSASLDATYSLEVLENSITAEQIVAATITADLMAVVNLASVSANLGTVTAGILQSPDQTFTIDLADKEIMITGPNGQALDDYTVIRNGVIESWEYVGGTHQLAKALTHIESGVATNNTTVNIPGYFASQPSILVSPKEIMVYDQSNSTQDQTLKCEALSITEYATGQWQFTARASLVLAAGGGTTTVNWTNGSTSAATINSATQTTPANTTDFTASIRLKSIRGTGTAPNYYLRKVVWTIFYRAVGDTTWLTGATTTTYIGSTIDWVDASGEVTGLTADDYEFYIEAVYSDHTGTFQSGTGGYNYDTHTTSQVSDYVTASITSYGDDSEYISATLPSYSPPAGWAIYNVEYKYKYGFYLEVNADAQARAQVTGISGLYEAIVKSFGGTETDGVDGANNLSSEQSFSGSPYTQTVFNSARAYVSMLTNNWNCEAQLRIADAYAVIYIREPIANSATASNDLNIVDFQYETGAATQINSGLLNWQAVGR